MQLLNQNTTVMKTVKNISGAAMLILLVAASANPAFSQTDRSVRIPDQIEKNVNELRELAAEMNQRSRTYLQSIETLTSSYTRLYEEFQGTNNESEKRYLSEKMALKTSRLYGEIHAYYSETGRSANRVVQLAEDINNAEITNNETRDLILQTVKMNSAINKEVQGLMRRHAVVDLYGSLSRGLEQHISGPIEDYQRLSEIITQYNSEIESHGERHMDQMDQYSNSVQNQMGSMISQANQIRLFSDVMVRRVGVLSKMELQKTNLFERFHEFAGAVQELWTMRESFGEIEELSTDVMNPNGIFQNTDIDRYRSGLPNTPEHDGGRLFNSSGNSQKSRDTKELSRSILFD